jgi:hypothetical protein
MLCCQLLIALVSLLFVRQAESSDDVSIAKIVISFATADGQNWFVETVLRAVYKLIILLSRTAGFTSHFARVLAVSVRPVYCQCLRSTYSYMSQPMFFAGSCKWAINVGLGVIACACGMRKHTRTHFHADRPIAFRLETEKNLPQCKLVDANASIQYIISALNSPTLNGAEIVGFGDGSIFMLNLLTCSRVSSMSPLANRFFNYLSKFYVRRSSPAGLKNKLSQQFSQTEAESSTVIKVTATSVDKAQGQN